MNKLHKKIIGIVLALMVIGVPVAYAAAEALKWDVNDEVVSGGITDDANLEIRNMRVDPATNALLVTSVSTPTAATDYYDGRKVVAAAATAEPLAAASTLFVACDVQAEESNTGDIMIGASTVVEAPGTDRGIRLIPGANYHMERPGDLQYIYIDAEVNGDGVVYFCQK